MFQQEWHGYYCVKLKHGRLILIDPKVAMKSMLVKWIFKMFEGGRMYPTYSFNIG